MQTGRLVNAIIAAFFVGLGLYMLIGIAITPLPFLFLIFWIAFGYWFYKQDSSKHIWRKGFIFLAIESFLIPIVTFIFSARMVGQSGNELEAVGTAIGGGIATLFTGFLGFFFGIVFLLIGLFAFKVPHDVKFVNTVKVKAK